MADNISIYLHDDALKLLDEIVAQRSARDREAGLSGRQVTSRSSLIEELVLGLAESRSGEMLSLETISYHVVELAREYGAGKVSLFGSYARNEARADSDVDILLDKGAINGLRVIDFQNELAERLGKSVDVVTTTGASESFLNRIKPDVKVLYAAS